MSDKTRLIGKISSRLDLKAILALKSDNNDNLSSKDEKNDWKIINVLYQLTPNYFTSQDFVGHVFMCYTF